MFKRIPLVERKSMYDAIQTKFPGKIPVVVQWAPSEKNPPPLKKYRYLMNPECKMGKLLLEIRQEMKLGSEHALFMFVGEGVLPPATSTVAAIYSRYADHTDRFLYVTIIKESTFGHL